MSEKKRTSKEERFIGFKVELNELCRRHMMHIVPSMYDSLQVWALSDGEDPFSEADLENHLPD